MTFGTEKIEWFGYLTVTRFDRMYERDRQTDGPTDSVKVLDAHQYFRYLI